MSRRFRICMAKGGGESRRPSYGRSKLTLISKENNSERPVDALAEKHISLTDNLKSRDASASKKVVSMGH